VSTRATNCLILVCDGCGDDYEHDYTPHFDTLADAREESINAGEWRTDGKDADWCPACQGKAHDCAPDPEDTHTCARCGTALGAEAS
jgi:hypothetical protein